MLPINHKSGSIRHPKPDLPPPRPAWARRFWRSWRNRPMREGGTAGTGFADDHRHANDAYTKAASDERDKLLDTRIKSICRSC